MLNKTYRVIAKVRDELGHISEVSADHTIAFRDLTKSKYIKILEESVKSSYLRQTGSFVVYIYYLEVIRVG